MLLSVALSLSASLQLAGTLPTGAKPANDPTGWIKITDYPADALTGRQAGTVAFKLDVDTSGNVSACRIVATSGSASLDTMTCALLFIRARFTPARDAAGAAIDGSFSSRITWVFPPDYKASPSALKPVELRRGIRDATGKSVLRIGEDGIIATCIAAEGAYSNILPLPDVCKLFPVGARYGPPATVNGKPVKREVTITLSVYDVTVR